MISTHILDTTKGFPAQGVFVKLQRKENLRGDPSMGFEVIGNSDWKDIGSGKTNADGRCTFECEKKTGVYQIIFDVENYFQSSPHFFSDISITFKIEDLNRKYHVPLLLNPFGYSTYRGS